MEKLTASNILGHLQRGYDYELAPHQTNGIKMGTYAFEIYKVYLASINPNLSLPINYLGAVIEVDETLSPETIEFYLKFK